MFDNISNYLKSLVFTNYDSSTQDEKVENEGSKLAQNGSIFNQNSQYANNDKGTWPSLTLSKEALKVMDGHADKNGNIIKDGKITVEDDYWQNETNKLNKLSADEKKKLNLAILDKQGNVDKQKLFDLFNSKANEASNKSKMSEKTSLNHTGGGLVASNARMLMLSDRK